MQKVPELFRRYKSLLSASILDLLFAQTALKCMEYAERPSTCKKSKRYWKHEVLTCFQRSTFVLELVTLPQNSFVLRLLWTELVWSFEELGTKQILQLKDLLRFSYGNEDSLTYVVLCLHTDECAHRGTPLPACRVCLTWWALQMLAFQWAFLVSFPNARLRWTHCSDMYPAVHKEL